MEALSDCGISVPDGWLTKHLKICTTVDIKFTELYAKVENQPEPASTYLYLEVSEEYENVQMILTDADGTNWKIRWNNNRSRKWNV